MGGSLELDPDDRLVADDPPIVSRRDPEDVTGLDLGRAPIVVLDLQPARSRIPDVLDLTAIRADHRPDALGPPPSGLERRPLDPAAREPDQFDRRLVHRLRLVRLLEAPALDTWHVLSSFVSAPVSVRHGARKVAAASPAGRLVLGKPVA